MITKIRRRPFIKKSLLVTVALSCGLAFPLGLATEGETAPPQTLFTNVNVFNGTDNKLYRDQNVLVEGNLIKSVSDSSTYPFPISFPPSVVRAIDHCIHRGKAE